MPGLTPSSILTGSLSGCSRSERNLCLRTLPVLSPVPSHPISEPAVVFEIRREASNGGSESPASRRGAFILKLPSQLARAGPICAFTDDAGSLLTRSILLAAHRLKPIVFGETGGIMITRCILVICAFVLMSSPLSPAGVNPALMNSYWKAQWISCPKLPQHDPGLCYLRKVLTLATAPSRFVVHVSGDNR